MKKDLINRTILKFVLLAISCSASAQLTPSEAGFLDAVTDFGADNTGASVTTAELQAAINAATSQHQPLYLPAGTYLVDATLKVSDDAGGDRDAQNTFITGSSVEPENRTVILLKAGSFPLAHKHVIRHEGFGSEKYPDTFNRILQSIDIRIEENNSGAIGLRWRGAEGCGIFDINIDVTGGAYGMEMLPGSGGSCADITINGGKRGIFLPSNGVQPTPTITKLTMSGQTDAAIYSDHSRGAITITGAHFIMNPGVPVFSLARHTGLTWSPGGNPVLTDCVIEYPTEDPGNLVMVMVDDRDQSVHFSDVYIKNAAKILDEDATATANPSGWRYYREFAYNSGWDESAFGDEPVYIDGAKQAGRIYEVFEDDLPPPPDVQSRHGWGDTFPAFNTHGAVNLLDYESYVQSYDWAPAFNAAIEAAEASGSNVVFVPVGKYITYNTIYLKEHTALVGAGHQNSIILGRDDANRRFGGSESGWTNPRPMIETPNSNSATCILADIAVRVNGPFNGDSHSSEAMACYAILWQAGNHSIIRNIDYMRALRNNNRAAWALKYNLTSDNWISLRNINSPSDIGGFTFHSDCAHAYHTSFTVPSRILVETVGGDKRIMTRSMPPARMNAVSNSYELPNLSIKSSTGELFTLESLKIANASWLASEGTDVTITGYGSLQVEQVISLAGLSRETEIVCMLNWTDLDSVVLTSPVPFSIDDISMDGTLIDFESVEGTKPLENVDYDHQCSGYGFMHLPMYILAHPYVTITGGCKYYNHWKHGSTWLRITEPYVEVKDNEPGDIVSFYHTHAQHSQNFYKFRIHNAHNVSLFGIKTENALEFAHIDSSENIRVFGHGGMTNPPRGVAHYRVENTRDFEIVSPSDEVITTDDVCRACNMGDVMLPGTTFGQYDDIQYLEGEILHAPDRTDSPILYLWGNPHDPWSGHCDVQFEVTVDGGTGGGFYCLGDRVTLRPVIPECKVFVKWTGDNELLEDSTASTAVITAMPETNVELTAVYADDVQYALTVINGAGSGEYCMNSVVTIRADDPAEGMIFSHWSGQNSTVTDTLSVETDVTLGDEDITLTAEYSEIVMYSFSAGFTGMGSVNPFAGQYEPGTVIEVTATPDEGYIFRDWTGDVSSTENPLSVTIDQDISIIANFVTDTVGIGNSLADAVKVYPNPLQNGNLQIESPVPVRVVIMNITGQTILETSPGNLAVIEAEALQPGIYMVKVVSDLFTSITKVIRE